MLRNTPRSWGSIARAFHWSIALLIAIQIPIGFWLNDVYSEFLADPQDPTRLLQVSLIHNTLGFIVLFMVFLRLGWRLGNPAPELPAGIGRFQRWLARTNQAFLYALLLIFPLSGWAALSAYSEDFPIFFFGWENVPRLVPQRPPEVLFSYEWFAVIHRGAWRVGALLLGLHIAGALWHHFVRGDNVARRMVRGD